MAEESTEESVEEREPLPIATALSWLASIKAAPALALLREPDFALISMRAFTGFRVNAQGYANPLVRSRLAQEAIKDDKFADKLRALAEESPLTSSSGGTRVGAPLAAPSSLAAPSFPSGSPRTGGGGDNPSPANNTREQTLRAERDRRKRERDEARDKLAQTESILTEAARARQQAEEARSETAQRAEKQAQRLARLERQVIKLQAEQKGLLRALRQDKVSPPRRAPSGVASPPVSEPGSDTISPWQTAVEHLLHKSKHDQARALAEDVLRGDPNEPSALDIAARASLGRGETDEATILLRRLLHVHLERGQAAGGGAVWLRLLELLPQPADGARETRQFLSVLRPDDSRTVESLRLGLARLRGAAPSAHEWLTGYLTMQASPALAQALMPPPGALGPDDPLPLDMGLAGRFGTARQICEAVQRGEVLLVEAARLALTSLRETDPTRHGRVLTAFAQAADEDPSVLTPLQRTPHGPVVVDGSNVAWFDQETLADPHPRLRSLLALRRTLRARGFFPVVIFADANLPYLIDDAPSLRALLDQKHVSLVDRGVDADEVLLREAKRLSAPLVTNDYMTDWDPEGEVEKIGYTISMTGDAHLLFNP